MNQVVRRGGISAAERAWWLDLYPKDGSGESRMLFALRAAREDMRERGRPEEWLYTDEELRRIIDIWANPSDRSRTSRELDRLLKGMAKALRRR